MRDFEMIILGIGWGFIFAVVAAIIWFVYNLDLFPQKRLRNIPFSEVKIGQTFYDYGGEESRLREYIKTGESEAGCLSIKGRPIIEFDGKNTVKVEIETLKS